MFKNKREERSECKQQKVKTPKKRTSRVSVSVDVKSAKTRVSPTKVIQRKVKVEKIATPG